MIESEFDEILYLFLNRKIGSTQSKEEFLKKYKETVKAISNAVARHRQEHQTSTQLHFNFRRYSAKDRQKDELLRRQAEDRQRKLQEEARQREMRREERERVLMKREDFDVKDDEISEASEEYYD